MKAVSCMGSRSVRGGLLHSDNRDPANSSAVGSRQSDSGGTEMGFFDKLKERTEGVLTSAKPGRRGGGGVRGRAARAAAGDQREGADDPQRRRRRRRRRLGGEGRARSAPARPTSTATARSGSRSTRATTRPRRPASRPTPRPSSTSTPRSRCRAPGSGASTSAPRRCTSWPGSARTTRAAAPTRRATSSRWGALRQQVMDVVTGAGWTYKPRKV